MDGNIFQVLLSLRQLLLKPFTFCHIFFYRRISSLNVLIESVFSAVQTKILCASVQIECVA